MQNKINELTAIEIKVRKQLRTIDVNTKLYKKISDYLKDIQLHKKAIEKEIGQFGV